MVFHLHDQQLRVFRKHVLLVENIAVLKNCRLLVIQHMVGNTARMLSHLLDNGIELSALIIKPYSVDEEAQSVLSKYNLRIILKDYNQVESTDFLDQLIREYVEKSKTDGKKLVLWDIGGYFAKPLTRCDGDLSRYIGGVIEDTTFGHNRYIEMRENISVPILSVARSPLKEVEARFVGRDAISSIERSLRQIGVTLAGRNALVVGYGMIGTNVARTLSSYDCHVSVYDKKDIRNLHAFIDGFQIHKKRELIKNADLIFSATANQALSFEEIEDCKDGVILASVGSKDTEFDVSGVKRQALSETHAGLNIKKYTLPNSKDIYIVRDGTAVNFALGGQPDEVMDLVFSEILLSTIAVVKNPEKFPVGVIHTLPEASLNRISRDWLRFVN